MIRTGGVGALVVLLASWAFGTGRYGGPDEPAHVLRAAAVAAGEVRGAPAPDLASGYRIVTVPARLATGDPACFRHDARLSSACATPGAVPAGMVRAATSAGVSPPLYYALVGLPVRVLGDPADVWWYRAVAVVLNAIVLMLAMSRLRPFGATAVVALAAFTPAAWFLLGVVNPNGFELALALLAWVGVARLHRDPPLSAAAWLWISVPVAVAVTCRPVALMMGVAVAGVCEVLRRPGRRDRVALYGPVLAAAVLVTGWSRLVGMRVNDPRTASSGSTASAIVPAVRAVPTTVSELVASLGWLEFAAPAVAVAAWLVVVALGISWHRPAPRTIRALVVLLLVVVVVPVMFEIAVHRTVGPIWQGRYSLPTFVGIIVLLLQRRTPLPVRAASALVAAAVVVEVSTYWWAIRRYAVGTHGSWWLHDPSASSAVFDPRVWLLINVAVATTSGAIIVHSLRQPVTCA